MNPSTVAGSAFTVNDDLRNSTVGDRAYDPQLPVLVHQTTAPKPFHPFDQARQKPLSQDNIKAFWELWGSYRHELLFRHGLHWMGGNLEDAEDAISSTGLKALEYLSLDTQVFLG